MSDENRSLAEVLDPEDLLEDLLRGPLPDFVARFAEALRVVSCDRDPNSLRLVGIRLALVGFCVPQLRLGFVLFTHFPFASRQPRLLVALV